MRVLLLHALPLDERMWEPQLDALAAHDVVAPNLYALAGESMDAWATELLHHLGDDAAVVVGASMGGYAALALARLAPERVRAAALHAASPADLPPAEDVLRGIAAAIGIEGAEHGYEGARDLPAAVTLARP